MDDLIAALCLVAVVEGLVLLVAPAAWKRAAEQLQAMATQQVRVIGAVLVGAGLLSLVLVRGLG